MKARRRASQTERGRGTGGEEVMKLELSIFYERRAKTKENGKTAETNTNNREGKKKQ